MQFHDFGHISETYLRSEFNVTYNFLGPRCQGFQRQIEAKPMYGLGDVFEPDSDHRRCLLWLGHVRGGVRCLFGYAMSSEPL